ncbi:MAG: glycosyltransferase family 2 protein [Candidatus Aureabacteria bacterium]|nr:glycosyltransferase family 2 protein [Candidatus Auribacterota bacterium]
MPVKKLSVIVPCYNEADVITDSYSSIKKVLETNFPDLHEMIFIDDGSTDNTLSLLRELAAKDSTVKIITFSRNFGQQPAISAGIHCCQGELAVIMDADLQDPPALIPEMVRMHEKEKANVIYAVRRQRLGEGAFKKITSSLYYRILNYLSNMELHEDTGDFRLIDKNVIDAFRALKEKNKYIRGLISWLGFKQIPVYYDRSPRFKGKTKYSLSKMLSFAGTGLLYFSTKPLLLTVILGFLCTLVGLFLGVFFVIKKALYPQEFVHGWTSTIIIIIFFGGIQLISIGVLGRYIGSIFEEIKGRPEYIIKEQIN